MTKIHKVLPSFLSTLTYTFNSQNSLVQRERMYYYSRFMTESLDSENLNGLPKVIQTVGTTVQISCLLTPYFSTTLYCQVERHMPFRKGTVHAVWQSSASMRICGDSASSSSEVWFAHSFQIAPLSWLQGLQFLNLHNEREALRIQITP